MNLPALARLSVAHATRYDYSRPVSQAQHVACLQPLTDEGQRLAAFALEVSPEPSHHSTHWDTHGNCRANFAIQVPHTQLRVVARSEVHLRPRYRGLTPAASPSCEAVRAQLRYRAQAPFQPAGEFALASPYVPMLAALRDYAECSLRPDRPLAEAALELMRRIHEDFAYAPASTEVSTPLLNVFEQRKGVCQDFAHLMLGCLRAWGLAARYVSGYLLTQTAPGEVPWVGADASHAWVSVWIPGLGLPQAGDWLDLDPTNHCVPDLQHVRVAQGRDFGDVTPLRGVIRGGGEHTLQVHVTTTLLPDDGPSR